jgi:hypothetical protein
LPPLNKGALLGTRDPRGRSLHTHLKGYDWITNFNFDNDNNIYSNNKQNWENIKRYTLGQKSNWKINPTLYTAIIEYMTNGIKDIVLIYHVYHAKQPTSIHDWE